MFYKNNVSQLRVFALIYILSLSSLKKYFVIFKVFGWQMPWFYFVKRLDACSKLRVPLAQSKKILQGCLSE